MDITSFDPLRADSQDLTGYGEVMAAAFAVDNADAPPIPVESLVARLQAVMASEHPPRLWLARQGGRVAAVASVRLPETENTHLIDVVIRVHPDLRRHGIGTESLRTVLRDLRDQSRGRVGWQGVTAGGAGQYWTEALGFDVTHAHVLQVLTIADVDAALWEVPVSAGYRLQRWLGAAPEEILASYAHARNAIQDATQGNLTYEIPKWTPERVREDEDEHRRDGVEQWVVVAVHESTGEVVGTTEIEVHPAAPDQGFQAWTAVTREHRGHGLGRCMKAAMMRWLPPERPSILRVSTNTGADNVNMIRTNHAVGYTTVRTMLTVEIDRSVLEANLRLG